MIRLAKKFRNTRLQVRLSLPVVLSLILLLICQWMLYAFLADVTMESLYATSESVIVSISSLMESRMRSVVERIQYTKLNPSIENDLRDYLLRGDAASEAVTQTRLSASLPLYKLLYKLGLTRSIVGLALLLTGGQAANIFMISGFI